MRQLIVVAEMGSGGAESIVVQLVRAARDRGDDVVLATSGGWRLAALRDTGVEVLDLPLRAGGPVRTLLGGLVSVRRLRRLLSHGTVDLVHAHNVRATVVAGLALGRRRGPAGRPTVVTTVHGLAPWRYRPSAWVLGRVCDAVVAVSSDVARRLQASGLPEGRLQVVPNAAEHLELPDRDRARLELGCPRDGDVVLCLARLVRPKRQDLLLDAWARLPSPPLLLVAGGGPGRARLESRSAQLGLRGRVRFLGDRSDVARLLAAADVLVLPTDDEGLPVTVLEAMAHGVPVVASRVGGLLDLDPTTLVLVPAGSRTALAAAVVALLARPDPTAQMVERAREASRTAYSSARMIHRYHVVYATARRPTR